MQYDHIAYKVLICGQSGSGKTTYFLQVLHGLKSTCIFLYDPQGEFSRKLGRPVATTLEGCIAQIKTGWVLYSNSEMFQGDPMAGGEWFATFAFHCCAKIPGRKLFAVDELQNYAGHNDLGRIKEKLPNGKTIKRAHGIALVLNEGRRFGLDMVAISQSPNEMHFSVRRQMTEAVCFFIPPSEVCALGYMVKMGFNIDEITHLPTGHFIARNLKSSTQLRGKTF